MGRMDGNDREPPVTSRGGEALVRGGWGRRILTGLIAFAALGGFALVVVYSYDKGREAGSSAIAPVIQAQEGPTKIRPESPGGMVIPYRDKQVYSRIDPGQRPPPVEHLLPPPEPVVAPPPAPAPVPDETRAMRAGPAAEDSDADPSPESETSVKDVPPPPPPPPRPASEKRAAAATARPSAPPEPESEPRPKERAAAAPAEPQATAPDGAYRVQILSSRSEDAARRAWSKLSARHKDLFGRLEPEVVRAEISGKGTYYRLQAGPLADASEAKALCDKIKSRKLGCLVVRP